VQEGEHDSWIQILQNKTHKLYHGFYATRLAATKEIDNPWEDIRKKEMDFFRSSKDWRPIAKNRLGTSHLTEALSLALSGMIQET